MSVRFGGRYVIGVDFGTLTARAVVVRVDDGQEVGTAVHAYRHGVIDQRLPTSGEPLPPDWALQDPDDYVESMTAAVRGALADSGVDAGEVIGIGTDFTACTMVPTLADGTPLSHLAEYKDRPHAFVKLWKHHAAQPEADRINAVAAGRGEPWLARYGGLISSEWEYAKALELLRDDPEVYRDDGAVGRGRRLDRVAAVRRVRAQCLLGRLQGHPPGRPLPEPGLPRRGRPGVRRLRRHQARPADRPLGRPRRLAHRRDGRPPRSRRGHRRRRRQRRRPRDRTGGPGGRPGTTRRDHGHLDVSRRQRRAAPRGARHVRCRRRRDRGRTVGLRGRSERGRRSVRLVRRHRRARGVPRRRRTTRASASTTTSRCSARRRPSASTACSPSTGTTATARCSSTTSCPASSSA